MRFSSLYTLLLVLGMSLIYSSTQVQAQKRDVCGTEFTDEMFEKLEENKKMIGTAQIRERKNIPVYFHIISKSDGTDGVEAEKIFDAMCYINEFYNDKTDLYFYLAKQNGEYFNYIESDRYYENPSSSTAQLVLRNERNLNAVNIFVAKNARESNGPGTVLAYYTPSGDYIVSRKANVGASSTLSHELGHFFNLPHPFFGWEGTPWNEADHGNPVTQNSINGVQIEVQNGSNCNSAADRICDTPPDYNFGLTQNGCNYTRNVMDKNNDVVEPMSNNIMSYFDNCNPYDLTDDQIDIVIADSKSSSRNYLDNDETPMNEIGEFDIQFLNGFEDGGELPFDNAVIDWEDVPNAEAYVIEYDVIATFTSPLSQTDITYSSNFDFSGEQYEGNTVYFRIMPVNAWESCDLDKTSRLSFQAVTGVNVDELNGKASFEVFPNPIQTGSPINIDFYSQNATDAQISIVNLSGKEFISENLALPQGRKVKSFNTQNMTSGVYIMKLTIDDKFFTKKILIQ